MTNCAIEITETVKLMLKSSNLGDVELLDSLLEHHCNCNSLIHKELKEIINLKLEILSF